MKKLLNVLSILILGITLLSCQIDTSAETPFSIIGKWGMIDGTIDGKEYGPLGPGTYYQTIEFKTNGTYIEDAYSSVNTGVYIYDAENKFLQMKDSEYSFYVPTYVTIHTNVEITLLLDYGQIGTITKHLTKIL